MRAAVLLLAVDHLGTRSARPKPFVDDAASLRVSEKLGYRLDGTATQVRRARAVVEQRLLRTARDASASELGAAGGGARGLPAPARCLGNRVRLSPGRRC
jgi:hypothetical protein